MPPTDAEIELTRKLSLEIAAQSDRLAEEALDPAKQLEPLFAGFDKEIERMGEVLQTEGAPEGTGIACFVATAELIGDWAELEVTAAEGLEAAYSGKRTQTNGPSRAPVRRGMRI